MKVWLFLGLLPAGLLAGPAALFPQELVTHSEIEHFLRTAEIVKVWTLAEGTTRSRRATLFDGKITHDVHLQTVDEYRRLFRGARRAELNFRDSYRYNIAAYLLDRILCLNMVPVSVERKVQGKSAAVTWWVDDIAMSEHDRFLTKTEPPNRDAWNQQIGLVRVFDQLIYNTDRNLGNVLIGKDWKIWLIDHTRAFRVHKSLSSREGLTRCDRRLLVRLRNLETESLWGTLIHYLKKREIEALLVRRDEIVRMFDEKVAQKGETGILYDYLPACSRPDGSVERFLHAP